VAEVTRADVWLTRMAWLIALALGAFLAYHLLKKLLGGSLTSEQITNGFLAFQTALMMALYGSVSQLKGAFGQFEKRFHKLDQDFAAHSRKRH